MKIRKRGEREIFGISFLDVISCGFGAVLALVIMANKEEQIPEPALKNLVERTDSAAQVAAIKADIEQFGLELTSLEQREAALKLRLAAAQAAAKASAAQIREASGAPVQAQTGTLDSIYAGGIPVGREYIIFIIDTSGSMQRDWARVVNRIKAIIAAHPKVKGLQIMSDNGGYLIDGYAGRWIPDTQSARARVVSKLASWSEYSNSSPAKGLELALKKYAGKGNEVSIYVFGDDFTGSSYQQVIDVIDRWNIDPATGSRSAIIHGVGFPGGLGNRFATLMREVATQNGGVFVAL